MIKLIHNVGFKFLLLAVSLSFLTACGGGGSSTTAPNIVFSLYPTNYLSAGYSESYSLTGTDTAGGTHQGNLSTQTQAQTVFNSQAAIPRSLLLSWTNTQTSAFISIPVTAYSSTSLSSFRDFGSFNPSSGVTTVTANTTIIPQTAQIGDFGNIGTYTDSAGASQTVTWQLTDAGSGNANLVTMSGVRDQFGTIIGNTETTTRIDANGNRLSISMRIYIVATGIALTLSGSNS